MLILLLCALFASTPPGPSQPPAAAAVAEFGAYFGQAPPGDTARVFAPGIISAAGYRLHGFPAFSPDLKEVYWPVIPPRVMFTQQRDGAWTAPAVASFLDSAAQAPVFSPGGDKLFFQCRRDGGYGSLDIWYVEKRPSGWSEPYNLGPPVNTEQLQGQPSFTDDGTVYFANAMENTGFDRGIFRARRVDGVYQPPAALDAAINTRHIDAYPFVARDESYLLFCSSRPGNEESELRIFVSFPTPEGGWGDPVDLTGVLGVEPPAKFPYVSPDGKYLFFLAEGEIYWIDAGVITTRRDKTH